MTGDRGAAGVIADLQERLDAVADPVPFRAVVRDESHHPLIETTVAALVGERERFIQTGIGWVVSDMSKAHPGVAATFEVIRRHTRYLPDHERYKDRKRKGGDQVTRAEAGRE